MEHVHAKGLDRTAFPVDKPRTGLFAYLRKTAQHLSDALHRQNAAPKETRVTRRAPDPYFDVWMEKRLHGDRK